MKLNKNIKYGASALALALAFSACSNENANKAKDDAKDAASHTETAVNEEVDSTKDKVDDKVDSTKDTVDEKVDSTKDSVDKKVDELKAGIEDEEFDISLDDAVDKFKEEFNQESMEISSVKFDEEDDKYAYDIKGYTEDNEYEAKIDAESGEIISKEEEKEKESKDDKSIDFVAIKSPKEAMTKALENNEGQVKSYELKYNDDDKLVYNIDIEDGDDVELDAETLDIIHK
ncbi:MULTISPECIES: PepSY domain-containing protein [Anaerococcus]|uniref:PepSY domain-containing protein n=1 Tax=Anaerococcus TaxID=165779 RepID=UPI001AE219F3|nr:MULTISPECIES: PepSY domain-containing protein [Anaerococcus]MBP2068957.1 putative membrane protein YkoI [Anaerococcus nagyae]MDU1829076.1 PepSY domain-containing protein [Anaerococcus sp.]MDU1865230.1 PepSY domain-containing protein [Anaerococcus sp.]